MIDDVETTGRSEMKVWTTYKSAPNTETMAAGKPNAQYGALVVIRANNSGAMAVITQPIT